MDTEVCSPWATLADLQAPCNDYLMDTAILEESLAMATDVLFNLTGRRWPGECEDTIRPCTDPWWRWNYHERHGGRTWYERTCGCHHLREIKLPGRPATEIVEVKVDGAVVPPAAYRLDDQSKLVALDPHDVNLWPVCQYLERDLTEWRTFGVTYRFGTAPPRGGIRAAATLACQLTLATDPKAIADGRCRLPKRVTTITRQGVSLAVVDPLTLFADGLTGIAEVDMWVNSILHGDARRRATFIDPAKHTPVRRTGA